MTRKTGYVYIMANKSNSVLYTGVTSELAGRVYQHKSRLTDGFTKDYNVNKLVYYAVFDDIESAIQEEKRIKAGSRASKMRLIKSINPKFKDLYESILS